MDERINCTVDELAEALAVVIGSFQKSEDVTVSWSRVATETATFLNADRIPEPVTDTNEDWIYD